MTVKLQTIDRKKYEDYFLEIVSFARPDEQKRREDWQGTDHVFFFERRQTDDDLAEMSAWLESYGISHFICQSNVYTFIEVSTEADATLFWIRFKS
jgi:hypothetical protein